MNEDQLFRERIKIENTLYLAKTHNNWLYFRSNAFEVRSVDGKSSGIVHCEDEKTYKQWLDYIHKHIQALNHKSIKLSNKYLSLCEQAI